MSTPAIIDSVSINEILRNIPHRFPFLLIDRVIRCEPGKLVKVVKNVTNTEWFFSGVPLASRTMPPPGWR